MCENIYIKTPNNNQRPFVSDLVFKITTIIIKKNNSQLLLLYFCVLFEVEYSLTRVQALKVCRIALFGGLAGL